MNAIGLSSNQVNKFLADINHAKTDPALRAGRRPLNEVSAPTPGQADAVALSPAALKPEQLKLNPEIPEVTGEELSYCQLGSTEEVCFALGLGNLKDLRGLGKELHAENRLLQGEVVNV